MSGSWLALIELLLVFGLVLGFGVHQWWQWRKWKREQRRDDER